MVNLPPTKVATDLLIFPAINTQDPNDRFAVVADNEMNAKLELVDKLGYAVKEIDGYWCLIDADVEFDPDPVLIGELSFDRAIDSVLQSAHWKIGEPVELIGGSIGEGFSGYDQ